MQVNKTFASMFSCSDKHKDVSNGRKLRLSDLETRLGPNPTVLLDNPVASTAAMRVDRLASLFSLRYTNDNDASTASSLQSATLLH